MEIRPFLHVLARRWRIVTLALVLCLGGAAYVASTSPAVYSASATLYVAATDGGDVNAAVLGSQLSQSRVRSYANLISSTDVAEAVIRKLGLSDDPRSLRGEITASVVPETTLIIVTATDGDPARARDIANAFGSEFAVLATELERPVNGAATPTTVKVNLVERAPLGGQVGPHTKLDIALGLIFGLLLGGSAAALREVLDTTIKTSDDLATHAGGSVLGVIGFDADVPKRPLLTLDDTRSPRGEALRQLRTNISYADVDHGLSSLVISSALPGEGKSTLSCNLALLMAQAGKRVILVEGDLRRPSVRDYMGIEGSVGLTNALVGQVALEDVLQPWGGLPLEVLPSGPIPPNPSELLASHAMAEAIALLEARADVVIFDAPPLLPVTDGAILAAKAGGVILVARSGRTTREQTRRATELLRNVDARLLGVVLNMANIKGRKAYGYGYGYGYSSTADLGSAEPTATLSRRQSEPVAAPTPPVEPQAAPVAEADPSTPAGREDQAPPAGPEDQAPAPVERTHAPDTVPAEEPAAPARETAEPAPATAAPPAEQAFSSPVTGWQHTAGAKSSGPESPA